MASGDGNLESGLGYAAVGADSDADSESGCAAPQRGGGGAQAGMQSRALTSASTWRVAVGLWPGANVRACGRVQMCQDAHV